jgi:hypothetical protein
MQRFVKEKIKHSNIHLKISKKFISVLVVFLLLSTLLSTVVGSRSSFFDTEEIESNNKEEQSFNKIFERKTLRERLEKLKEKIENIRTKLSQIKNSISDSDDDKPSLDDDLNDDTEKTDKPSFLQSFFYTIRELRKNRSPMIVYTNYNGVKKETELKLFQDVYISVDDQRDNDIKVKLLILPGIETKPLALSINFQLRITRLPGFTDKNAYLEVYSEYHFPGVLIKAQKGDKIKFGYESPLDEEVPNHCNVTYKYVPYFIYFRKKPLHKTVIDPGSSLDKSKLVLLLGYVNAKNNVEVSEINSRTIFDPAVQAKMTMSGTGILGGRTFTFKKEYSGPSKIDMICSFEKNDTTIYGYAYNIPNTEITFRYDFGAEGYIEFDSDGSSPSEIGICDDLYNPINRVYFSNLPSYARLEWTRDLLSSKKMNINAFSDSSGVGFNGYLKFPDIGTFDFSIVSSQDLDFSAELDLSEGYLLVNRGNVELTFDISAKGIDNNSIDLSFNLQRNYENYFKITFGNQTDDNMRISFATKEFVINDFNFLISNSKNKSSIGLKVGKIIKNNGGNIDVSLKSKKEDKNITFTITLIIEKGLEIQDLSLGLNGSWTGPQDFIFEGDVTYTFKIHIYSGFIYYIADDFSWGYFTFRGNFSLSSYRTFTHNGVECGFKGKIFMRSDYDELNFSWYTVNEDGVNMKKFNFSGLLFGLEDFHLYIGDKIDFAIPLLQGSINIVDACRKSGYIEFELQSGQSLLDLDFSFNIKGESGLDFNVEFDDFHIDIPDRLVHLSLAWSDYNVSAIKFETNSNINLRVEKLDIHLIDTNSSKTIFLLDDFTGYLKANLGFNVNINFPSDILESTDLNYIDLADSPLGFELTDVDVNFSIKEIIIASFSFGELEISAEVEGTVTFSLDGISFVDMKELFGEPIAENQSFLYVNLTFGIDAQNGNFHLNSFKISNISFIIIIALTIFTGSPIPLDETTVILEDLIITGYSDLTISLGLFSGVPGSIGIRFENNVDSSFSVGRMGIAFPQGLLYGYGSGIPTTAFIENVVLTDGVIDLRLRIIPPISFKIESGTAIDNIDFVLEFPDDLLIAKLTIDEPIEHFNFDINLGWNSDEPPYDKFILVDTQQTSIWFDGSIKVKKELINSGIDILNGILNTSIPYAKKDHGLRLDNVTFAADSLKIYLNSSAFPIFDGSLQISGEGKIYYLKDGSWEEILPGGDGFYLMLENGHLQILFDHSAENITIDFEKVLETGEQLIISGIFSIYSDNFVIDIWWDLETGYLNITTNIDVGLGIEDFLFKIDEIVIVDFTSFNILEGIFTTSFNIKEKFIGFELGGSSVTITGFDCYLYNETTEDKLTFDFDNFEFFGGKILISTIPGSHQWNLETKKEINWFQLNGFDFSVNRLEGGFSSLDWEKKQSISISASFDIDNNYGEFEIDRYTNQDSSLTLTDAYIQYRIQILNIPIGGHLRDFKVLYQKNAHEYFYLNWTRDDCINLVADIAASWNISFERFFNVFDYISSIDLISTSVDANFKLYYEPPLDNSTAHHLEFYVLDESSIELLEIVNNLVVRSDKIFTLGSLELQPGEVTIDWLIDNETGEGWINIDNDGITGDFSGLMLKKGPKMIRLLDVSLVDPGESYLDFEISNDIGSFYVLNSAKIDCTLLEFSKEGGIFRIEKAVESGLITIEPGEFNLNWVNLTSGDYDKEILINNGIFKFTLVKCSLILGNLEISCSFGDTDPDYNNDITLRLRNRGSQNRALYMDTGDGVQFDLFTFGISSENWNLEIDIAELKVDFDEFYIGYFEGNLTQGGDIDLSIHKFLNISYSWKDENKQNQEIFLQYENEFNNDPHSRAIVINTMDCTESLDMDFTTNVGEIDIIGTITIYPQRNIFWHFDFNPNKHENEDEGKGHFFIDTDNQMMGNLSLTVSRYVSAVDTTFGLKVDLELLKADEFYIYGKFTKLSGIFIPYDWEKSGSIDFISGTIHLKINDSFTRIWPLTPFAVLNKDTYGVTPEDPTVTFDMSKCEDFIFKIRWMKWDYGNGSGWTPWLDYPQNKKHNHDFTWMFINGQDIANIKFKVKTVAAESNVVLATVKKGYALDVNVQYSGYKLYEFDEFTVVVKNTTSGLPVGGATVTYNQSNQDGTWNEITNTTNSNGEAGFYVFSVPYDYYTHYSLARVFAEAVGYFGGKSESFRVYDTEAELNGFVRDNVTHIGIPNALVITDPGDYYTYSEEYPGGVQNGKFLLMVIPGIYDITASKDNYESITIEDVNATQGDAINLGNIYLPPLNYGGLRGTVFDAIDTAEGLGGVNVTVIIDGEDDIETKTGTTGIFPINYPSNTDSNYSIDLIPGTYTVKFEMKDYYSYTTQVTIVVGEVTNIDVYLYPIWITPTGHNNPADWYDEEDAHDDKLNTAAFTKIFFNPFWQWTEPLELELPSSLTCDRIRFYAKQIPNRIDRVKIEIYYENSWQDIYTGEYPDKEWVIKDFDTELDISKARISFRLRWYVVPSFADLHEFDFGFADPY